MTIWALGTLTDTPNWTNSQRIHQPQQNLTQAWGGTTNYKIDPDIDNATIVAGNGTKIYGYAYSSIDYPGATQTWAAGINDMNGTGLINAAGQTGAIVGYYHDSSNVEHGFLYANGTFSSLDYPGAPDAFALGINNSGQIVGGWCDSAGFCHGFERSASGTFSRIDYPGGSTFTQANGINDAGQIVGAYHNSTGFDHGFLQYGQFYTIDAPGATFGTQANAINRDAAIAGSFENPSSTSFVEYPFPPSWSGSFTSFNYGEGATTGTGIDNDNELLGGTNCCGGFLLTNNVLVTTFQYPGATSTSTQGVNDFGQIVGSYRDSSGNYHGFLVAAQ